MKVTVTQVRDSSHGVRVWLNEDDGTPDSGAEIDAMALIEPLNQYECEVTLTKGELNDEANIRIGLEALALGYRVLHFHRSAGGPASRWATYVKTVDGMDYYRVDLLDAAAKISDT